MIELIEVIYISTKLNKDRIFDKVNISLLIKNY